MLFLRDTKVGQMVVIPPPSVEEVRGGGGGEDGGGGPGGMEWGRPPLETASFLCLFVVFFFLWGQEGVGDREPQLDSRIPHSSAKDCWSETWFVCLISIFILPHLNGGGWFLTYMTLSCPHPAIICTAQRSPAVIVGPSILLIIIMYHLACATLWIWRINIYI